MSTFRDRMKTARPFDPLGEILALVEKHKAELSPRARPFVDMLKGAWPKVERSPDWFKGVGRARIWNGRRGRALEDGWRADAFDGWDCPDDGHDADLYYPADEFF